MIDTSAERAAILGRIRSALGTETSSASEQYATLPRAYTRAGALTSVERLDMFEGRLREYDAGVYRTTPSTLPQAIARVLGARDVRKMAFPAGLPASWMPIGLTFIEADDLSAAELDTCDGVLSGCTVAIALTGTIVLQNAPAQGPRKLSLVPDYHLCVVESGQIVETVPEAFDRLAKTSTLPTTFISGPSATADIEMTRIKGVHGPRFLDVLIVC